MIFLLTLEAFIIYTDMKRVIILLLAVFSGNLLAQTQPLPPSGGPDAWGYTWKSDQDPNGPTFQWVDITSTGTKITGLGDDNFVGPINMGINFVYYWNTYNQVYVGSNGFISFGQGFNIASNSSGPDFNDFPYASDQKNNVIGAQLSDLTFVKSNGDTIPGTGAYYETRGDSFIISFINVPFWSDDPDANPGDYKGSSTFQIILNAKDSSITINYLSNQCCVDNAYKSNFISRGMEDVTGTIGLDWDNDYPNANSFYVQNNSCVKIVPPATPQASIKDIAANWVLNPQSGGIFVERLSTKNLDLVLNFKNVGTVDMGPNDSVVYNVKYKNPSKVTLLNKNISIKGLKKGQDTTFTFANVLSINTAGSYSIDVIPNLSQGNFNDVNRLNDSLSSEIVAVVIDTTDSMATLRYDDGNWNGEGVVSLGAGLYIEPPKYPATLKYFVADLSIDADTNKIGNAIIEVYKNDGPNGGLGTRTDSVYLDVKSFLKNPQQGDTTLLGALVNNNNQLVGYLIRFTVPLTSNTQLTNQGEGFYVLYKALDNTNAGGPTSLLVLDKGEPFSRRTYEVIGGVWAPFRDANTEDFAMGLIMKMTPDVTVNITPVTKNISVYPNPASSYIHFYINENATVEVYDLLGNKVKTQQVSNKGSMFIGDLPQGLYIYRIIGNNTVKTGKFIVK